MKRREFVASIGAVGSSALAGGLSGEISELATEKINSEIEDHRNTARGLNIYAGTANKLYDDVAYWSGPMLGERTLSIGNIESALGEDYTESELHEFAKEEIYEELGFNVLGLNQDGQLLNPGMDFPEKRLLEEGEAEVHLIPLKDDSSLHEYLEDLAQEVQSDVSNQFPELDLTVETSFIEGGVQDPEESVIASQERYLDENPSAVQVYFSDQIEGTAGSATPNSPMAVVSVPSDSPEEWSEDMHDFLPHVTTHEGIGHSLFDINFHSFARDDVMSYNEKSGYTTNFSGLSELWINKYLDSTLELERTTKEVGGEEIEAVQASYVPGEVDHEEDLRVTRDHLKTILEDRYDINTGPLEFTGYDERRRTDEAFGDEEIVDIHTFRYGDQEYQMEVDNYIREIETV